MTLFAAIFAPRHTMAMRARVGYDFMPRARWRWRCFFAFFFARYAAFSAPLPLFAALSIRHADFWRARAMGMGRGKGWIQAVPQAELSVNFKLPNQSTNHHQRSMT